MMTQIGFVGGNHGCGWGSGWQGDLASEQVVCLQSHRREQLLGWGSHCCFWGCWVGMGWGVHLYHSFLWAIHCAAASFCSSLVTLPHWGDLGSWKRVFLVPCPSHVLPLSHVAVLRPSHAAYLALSSFLASAIALGEVGVGDQG